MSILGWKIRQKIKIIKHRSRYINYIGPELLYDWNDTLKSDDNGGTRNKNLTVWQTKERVEEFGRNVFFREVALDTNYEHINYQHISYRLEGWATPQIAYRLLITTEDHVLSQDISMWGSWRVGLGSSIRIRFAFACYHFINTRHLLIIKVWYTWAICCGITTGHSHLDATVKDVRLVWMAKVSCWVSGNICSVVLTAAL